MREVFDQYETIDGNNNIQEIVLKRKKRKVATKYFFSFLFFFLVLQQKIYEACLSRNLAKRVSLATEFQVTSDYKMDVFRNRFNI